jgi:hypothetical protein
LSWNIENVAGKRQSKGEQMRAYDWLIHDRGHLFEFPIVVAILRLGIRECKHLDLLRLDEVFVAIYVQTAS